MKGKLRSFFNFPYKGIGKFLYFQYFLLKFFPRESFPSMSLVPQAMKYFGIDTEDGFKREYLSRQKKAHELWNSKVRTTAEEIAAFYDEHDADIWRQAALSAGWEDSKSYLYKKKLLIAYHIARKVGAKNILDYGCGASAAGNYLAQKGYTVSAADVPSQTLEFVRRSHPFKEVLTISPELRLEDAYDYIMCLDALEHTLTPLEITKFFMTSLQKGGYLFITFPIEKDLENRRPSHTLEAQLERPATFDYLRSICVELVPEMIYKKL